MADLDYIHEGLRNLAIPIASLSLDPENARQHGERNIESVRESLKRFGQRKPIVVQKQGMIVRAGNGTLEAAQRLGWSHLAGVVCDDEDVEAIAYAIADNRTAELAEWHYKALAQHLEDLQKDGYQFAGLGWAQGEIDGLLREWDPGLARQPEHGEDAADGLALVTCPKCGEKFPQ